MEKNRVIIVLIACILAFSIGYFLYGSLEGNKADDFKEKTIAEMLASKTYLFNTSITIKTDGTIQGFTVNTKDVISGNGAVDVPNKRMLLDVTIRSGGNNQALSKTQNSQVYFIGDKVYFTSNETIVEQQINDSELIWRERTQLKQLAEIFSKSEFKVTGEESIHGIQTSILTLYPEKTDLVKYIAEQSSVGGAPLEISESQLADLSEMVKDYSLTLWVGKQDYLPRRFIMKMSLASGEISRESEIVMDVWAYGSPIEINLPKV